jgi:hypothetical protein
MSNRNDEFNSWYNESFGHVLGSEDDENREAVKKIWNGVLERAALKFEIEEFDALDGEQIGDKLRRMKER